MGREAPKEGGMHGAGKNMEGHGGLAGHGCHGETG